MQHFIPMLLEAVDIVVINAKCSVPTEIIRVLENSTVTVVGVGGSVRKGKEKWYGSVTMELSCFRRTEIGLT